MYYLFEIETYEKFGKNKDNIARAITKYNKLHSLTKNLI
jgi:hypothetical protein